MSQKLNYFNARCCIPRTERISCRTGGISLHRRTRSRCVVCAVVVFPFGMLVVVCCVIDPDFQQEYKSILLERFTEKSDLYKHYIICMEEQNGE